MPTELRARRRARDPCERLTATSGRQSGGEEGEGERRIPMRRELQELAGGRFRAKGSVMADPRPWYWGEALRAGPGSAAAAAGIRGRRRDDDAGDSLPEASGIYLLGGRVLVGATPA